MHKDKPHVLLKISFFFLTTLVKPIEKKGEGVSLYRNIENVYLILIYNTVTL